METATDVANLALSVIGGGTIFSIDDAEKAAELCKQYLSSAVDYTIGKGEFPRTIKREALTPYGQPVDAWAGSFQLPNDVIEGIALESGLEWATEGGMFFTDDPAPVLKYKRRPRGFGDLPTELVEAIACRLAFLVAMELTGDASKVSLAGSRFEVALRDARSQAGRVASSATAKAKLWGAP